ncbi:MAG: RNA polymerase sigma factor [Gaiellaceae bacterium]
MWALRVATRRALKAARKERLLRFRSTAATEQLAPTAPVEGRAPALKEAFDHLPPRLRATAVLRLQTGLSGEETAKVLGCSVGIVKSNLHDARQ